MAKKKQTEAIKPGIAKKITELIDGESDRGTILILGAYLEEILGELLRQACVSDEQAHKLLELRQPAGDFASKISICSAFGIISEDEATALNHIRKIRNNAAHFDRKGKGFDVLFDSDQTIDTVGNLARVMNTSCAGRKIEQVKSSFIASCRLLAIKLYFRGLLITRPKPSLSLKEMANAVRAKSKGTPNEGPIAHIDALAQAGDMESLQEIFKGIAKVFSTPPKNSTASDDAES